VPLGTGEAGEIAVKSDYLALAYWGRDDLTEASFSSLGNEESGRLYLTGDLGRVQANGYLEHLGRKDSQIKIRGYRVNMAEVKAALLGLDGIANAEVAVREDEPGHKALVAYLVPEEGHKPQVEKVRREISLSLPDYAMPAAFAVLDELPQTPTGKVDTRQLPDPLARRPELQRGWRAPENEHEQTLVDLWKDVLVARPIGTDDNFFDLGGDSLGAIQLMTRINHLYGKHLQVAVLLEAPTIRKMAAILRGEETIRTDTGLVPLQPDGDETAFFCVPPAAKTALVLADLAGYFAPNRPFYGLQHVGMNSDKEPHDRVEDMAAHYLEKVREAQPDGPYCLGGMCFGGIVALEMALQLKSAGQPVACLAVLDTLYQPRLRFSAMTPRFIFNQIRRLSKHKRLGIALARRFRPDAALPGGLGLRRTHGENTLPTARQAAGGRDGDAWKKGWIRHYSARGDYRLGWANQSFSFHPHKTPEEGDGWLVTYFNRAVAKIRGAGHSLGQGHILSGTKRPFPGSGAARPVE
jgi:acyl carrier protein